MELGKLWTKMFGSSASGKQNKWIKGYSLAVWWGR